jgi:hypothetical protein
MCLVCLGVAVGSAGSWFGDGASVETVPLPEPALTSQVEVLAPEVGSRLGLTDKRCTKIGKQKELDGVTYACKKNVKGFKWVVVKS